MGTAEEDKAAALAEKQIEMFKVKKLIKNLSIARGNGTSMISLIVPPGDQISRVNKMLSDEYGTASNIKSRVNRLSVLGAITSTQQRLKLYSKCPKNGLVLYCGTVVSDDGKERRVNIDFEPFKPINTSLYLCDNKFHTEALNELLMDDEVSYDTDIMATSTTELTLSLFHSILLIRLTGFALSSLKMHLASLGAGFRIHCHGW